MHDILFPNFVQMCTDSTTLEFVNNVFGSDFSLLCIHCQFFVPCYFADLLLLPPHERISIDLGVNNKLLSSESISWANRFPFIMHKKRLKVYTKARSYAYEKIDLLPF